MLTIIIRTVWMFTCSFAMRPPPKLKSSSWCESHVPLPPGCQLSTVASPSQHGRQKTDSSNTGTETKRYWQQEICTVSSPFLLPTELDLGGGVLRPGGLSHHIPSQFTSDPLNAINYSLGNLSSMAIFISART